MASFTLSSVALLLVVVIYTLAAVHPPTGYANAAAHYSPPSRKTSQKCNAHGPLLRGKKQSCPTKKKKGSSSHHHHHTKSKTATTSRLASTSAARSGAESLSNDYYATTCPQLESIIRNKVIQWIKIDMTLAASLLRLHFHDCMATGNDASILLTDPKRRSTEMYSVFSKGLRGFEVVDNIKLAVEKQCPGIVSCADVLTTIARDVVLEMGGPFWFVPFGRKDSLTSRIQDAALVPHQESDADVLLKQFDTLGLSFADLATLSGAHTVGRSHCFSFTRSGSPGANPSMNASYARFLHQECKPGPWSAVYNDPISPYVVDLQYYTNLKNNMGLFKSDHTLYADNDMTRSMIDAFLTQPGMWEAQFAVSMVNLGNVGVLTGPGQGEIRRVCSVRNPPPRRRRHH